MQAIVADARRRRPPMGLVCALGVAEHYPGVRCAFIEVPHAPAAPADHFTMTGARRPELADRALLARWHHDEGETLTEIARRIGCAGSAVSYAMRRHGLEIRPHLPPPPAELADEGWLRSQYLEQRRSIDTIARLLRVSDGRVRAALIETGIYTPRRRPEPEPDPVLDLPAHWRFLDES